MFHSPALQNLVRVGQGFDLFGEAKLKAQADAKKQLDALSDEQKKRIASNATMGSLGGLFAGGVAGYFVAKHIASTPHLAMGGAALWLVGGTVAGLALSPKSVDDLENWPAIGWAGSVMPGFLGMTMLGIAGYRWMTK